MRLLHPVAAWVVSLGQSSAARYVVRDVLLVLVALAFVAAAFSPIEDGLLPTRVTLVLALFAAVGGTAAALLAVLVARLTADHRIGWLSMVLGCYSLLAIPTAMIGTLNIAPASTVGAVRLLVHCIVVVLLVVALFAAAPLGRPVRRAVLAGVGSLAAAAALGLAFPAFGQAIVMSQPLRMAIVLAWTGAAFAIAVLAAKRQVWALWQVGAGLALLGIAHSGPARTDLSGTAELGLVFSCIRLLAVGLVLWGMLRLARGALDRLADEQAAHEEELRLAGLRLARSAERDHELRNGLAGLAGATSLMGADRADPLLTRVVASELCRLDELLRAPASQRRPSRSSSYPVEPVLNGLVILHAATGMDIRLDTDHGLHAIGSSDVLAQIVTNLIGNAARHAPGSPVRIGAYRDGTELVIRVRDFGPGVPAGREQAVFEPYVRDEGAGGSGLGLHICRKLIAAAGGSITLRPSTKGRSGCTVVVRMPAAPAPAPASRSFDPTGAWCRAS
jgi:two-component system, OmpR family, sensor kinase